MTISATASADSRSFTLVEMLLVVAIIALAAARSFGLIPEALLAPIATAATLLTVISMAALGLGVDVRTVAKAGGPVTAAVVLSLVTLGAVALAAIFSVGL
ncbi:hypothetical protein LCGC14_3022000 [marine sediment metagenome]|uniref:Prepilin-type N-terminal cleavage/methylation domain-containing protein n=1 Tax=marine sediment metagenome TaxID=412755 RepID=A0A0F8ZL56_9ZZZZ